MVKRKWAVLSLILVLLLVLSGCGATTTTAPAADKGQAGQGQAQSGANKTAEKFPTQPVHLIVQYPAGGGVDVTARLLAKYAEKNLGQNIVVENRVGGNGVLGVTAVTNAKPDGYTLGIVLNSTAVEKYLLEGVTYSVDSFEPIVQINFDPAFLVTKTGGKFDKPLPEIIQQTKSQKLNMGIGAVWIAFDFVKMLLQQETGAQFTRVGFQGGGPVTKAVLSGDVDLGMQFAPEWVNYYKSGELKGLAVSSAQRVPGFENIPTFKELGFKSVDDVGVRRFLVAPKGTPEETIKVLETAFLKALSDPQLVEDFKKAGMTVDKGDRKVAAEKFKAEGQELVDLVKKAGVKPGDPPK